ncbi:MAG TPA: flagellar export chaperone FlgN [Spirochaetota bacterium]|nr:flagellar export chaperone FlgN [Spirochaetota bacterium]HOM38599.1 flagellar export chaperone FlgN [Spirochaetota bacterium]HPQ49736.1 flagellar export chaperone FlgN [Spirochaetota bacterium]
MESKIKELYIILQRELKVIELINETEKMKNSFLVKGKLFDLSEINDELSKLIEENQKLENNRVRIINEIKEEKNMRKDNNDIKLKDIISIIENESLKNSFQSLYEKLKKEVEEIKYYSNLNNELIKASLEVIDITLKGNDLDMSDIDYTAKDRNNFSILINKII